MAAYCVPRLYCTGKGIYFMIFPAVLQGRIMRYEGRIMPYGEGMLGCAEGGHISAYLCGRILNQVMEPASL